MYLRSVAIDEADYQLRTWLASFLYWGVMNASSLLHLIVTVP
jgi:hypothetical protein